MKLWSQFVIILIAGGAVASATADEIGSAVKELPIFDAHVHYKEPAWGAYPPKTVIEIMDRNGVAMALVSSTPDAGTIKLWQYAPSRVVPELRPYHDGAGSSNWATYPGMTDYLKKRLKAYPHEGIGEFHVHGLDPADQPLLKTVAAMARERKIPVHIHSGAGPVRLFYELEPSLTVIWAHAGMSEPAQVVGAMMDKYPTLYADTSYREHDILGDGKALDSAWRKMLMRHQDRFMVGSDTWVNSQWDSYDSLMTINRRWLSKLPRAVAEKIAYKNAAKLFKRDISQDLIGTR